MNTSGRIAALLLATALALVGCKSSTDKPAAGSATPAPASQAAAPQMKNVQKPSATGGYATLAIPQATEAGSKIEVLEFFGYFCNHCHLLDPKLSAWVKAQGNRITFKRIPIRLEEAKLYYALEAMGKLDALHDKIFHAVQVEKKRLNTEAAATEFVAQHGVEPRAFIEQYQSFTVQSKASSANVMSGAYAIDGVPMLAIDGRYITSATHASKRPGVDQSEAGLQRAVLQIADKLVGIAQKERAAAKK